MRFSIYRGQLPADAEFNFLDHAKRLDMYGVELHKARVCNAYQIEKYFLKQVCNMYIDTLFCRIQQIRKYN